MFETPRSATLRPSTENGYALPPKVNVPSPQVTPTPMATALLVNLTVPDGAGSAAIATENIARQPNATSQLDVHFLIIAILLKLLKLLITGHHQQRSILLRLAVLHKDAQAVTHHERQGG